jgi:protein tyrosine/serine phosphatase
LTRERVLAWDGCVNVRDLGGLPLEGGGETRFGVVVRADSIRGLTESGWQALVDYGIGSVIDLRGDTEVAADPPRSPLVPVTRVPITPADEWVSMHETYLAQLALSRAEFSRAAALIAAAHGPVVVHCAGGRDRTGMLVALLLDAVGVTREAIASDHARSDESWAPHNEAWFAAAASHDERRRRIRVAAPAGRTMIGVLEEVDRAYGGAATYLETESLDTTVLRLRG